MKKDKPKQESPEKTMNTSTESRSQIEALLQTQPRILFDHNRKIVLLWTAKVGCTFLCKWFFAQMNLLDAALYFNKWVHQFREEVYYRSESYTKNIHMVFNDDFTVIKVVRNPFARAVSSYLTALFQALNIPGDPTHAIIKKEMEHFFHRTLSRNELFSFREYVSFLETLDITTCDIHHRQQLHPLEIEKLLVPDYILDLKESESGLKKIEKELNLKSIDLRSLKESPHHTNRESLPGFCGDKKFNWSPKLSYPTYRWFYDDELVRRIAGIYQRDFSAYGYIPDFSPEAP